MKFLQSLTDHLLKNGVPREHLISWAEDGELMASTALKNDGFERKYTANFRMENVKVDPNVMDALIVSWLMKYDPNREGRDLENPQFFCERLEDKRVDLAYRIDFKEKCAFRPDANGEWLIDNEKMSLETEFLDDSQTFGELVIFDSVTQDKSLSE